MEINELQKRIDDIKKRAHDDESAHGKEDQLRQDVLVAISKGAKNSKELAALVLKTSDIEFARWCA